MEKTQLSRRKFVGAAAWGAGALVTGPALRLFAAGEVPMAATLKKVWDQGKEYFMEFASAMPEDKFTFKPTEEVFSYSEQLLHVAGANYWFFAAIKGEKPSKPEEEFKAEGKSPADVIKVVEESFAYAEGAFTELTDESAAVEVSMGRSKQAVWKIILFGAEHITHHRGQMVVYLRLNGIKPPQYRSGFFG